MCCLLIYVGDLAKVPWKPEVKVKHAAEDNFEPSTEVHGEVCWHTNTMLRVSQLCAFTPDVALGPNETWRVTKPTLTLKKEKSGNFSSGYSQRTEFLLTNQDSQSQDLFSLKPCIFLMKSDIPMISSKDLQHPNLPVSSLPQLLSSLKIWVIELSTKNQNTLVSEVP